MIVDEELNVLTVVDSEERPNDKVVVAFWMVDGKKWWRSQVAKFESV